MVDYKTLVIGASPNSDRYSHQVVVRLLEAGIEVVPMGIKEAKIGNIKIVPPFTPQNEIHTISLYLSIEKQDKYTDFIIKLKPQRLIFNPGAENKILAEKLNTEGIFWENSCNLVLLATNQYQT